RRWQAGLQLGQHADRRTDLTRRAKAALEAVMLDEGGLQGVQGLLVAQAFDGDDLAIGAGDGEIEARVAPNAVDQDGAGAALPVIASLLAAGEAKVLAQGAEQRGARVERELLVGAVHREADLDSGRLGRASWMGLGERAGTMQGGQGRAGAEHAAPRGMVAVAHA